MQQFPYQLENFDTLAVGLIVLQQDETLEPELRAALPGNIKIFHTRIPSGEEVTEETLSQMEAQIPVVTGLLPEYGNIEVVAYCCTSGTTVIGETVVESAIKSVLPDVAVTNPLTAVKARLRALDARRLAMLTPYEPKVSQRMVEHLEGAGFEFVATGSFFEAQEKNVVRISDQSIRDAVLALAKSECDAIFASCTNLPTLGLLSELQKATGKPVISSNSALAWHIQSLLETS